MSHRNRFIWCNPPYPSKKHFGYIEFRLRPDKLLFWVTVSKQTHEGIHDQARAWYKGLIDAPPLPRKK